MDRRNAGGFQLLSPQTTWPEESDVRFKPGPVERFGDFGELPLASAEIEFAGEQQYGPWLFGYAARVFGANLGQLVKML